MSAQANKTVQANKTGYGVEGGRPAQYANLFTALLWAIVFTFISAADFFGLQTATRTQSERALQSVQQLVTSMFANNNKSIADDIVVIEYDEEDFSKYRWPIQFSYFNRLLDSFQQSPPKALFIDIILATPRVNGEAQFCAFADRLLRLSGNPDGPLWERKTVNEETTYTLNRQQVSEPDAKWLQRTVYREGENQGLVVDDNCVRNAIKGFNDLPSLEQTREDYAYEALDYIAGAGGGIPILLGVDKSYFSRKTTEESHVRPDAPSAGGGGGVGREEVGFDTRAYAMAQLAILDKVATFAPINTGLEGGRKYIQLVDGHYPSPAYLMARSVACNPESDLAGEGYRCKNVNRIREARDDAKQQQMLFSLANPGVQLESIANTKINRSLYLFWGAIPNENSTGCVERANIFPKTMTMLLFGQAYGASFGNAINYQPCPYHAVLPFGCSIQDASDGEGGEGAFARDDCGQLSLENKFVFMGVNVPLLRDTVTVPVQGSLPAVHAHSTAFDNYLRRNNLFATSDWDEVVILGMEFLLNFLALLIFLQIRDGEERRIASGASVSERSFLLRPLSTISAAQTGMLLGLYLLALGVALPIMIIHYISKTARPRPHGAK